MIGLVGGLGFIGITLATALRAEGIDVLLMDKQEKNLANPIATRLGCNYRLVDLTQASTLVDAFASCEILVHLAWGSVPSTAAKDPIADAHANILGTISLLEAAKQAHVRRIIFLSSGGTVYGAADAHPITEDRALRPIGIYGAAKAAVEAYIGAYAQTRQISGTIVRLSNPYGPGQSTSGAQGAVAVFTRRILDGEPIEIWGDGSTVRDYIHVKDAAQAVALLCRNEENYGVYNIGSGRGLSTLDLVKLIEKESGIKAKVNYLPARGHDIPINVLDCTKIRALGWRPEIDFDLGLRSLIGGMTTNEQPEFKR